MCCLAVPVVVSPQPVGPWHSWASCLSFALQQALVLLVPVGSLLPYGFQPSRWGHPCGVEASLSSIGTKVRCHGQFPGWASNLCLRLLFVPCPSGCVSRWSLALSGVLPCSMLWFHVCLHDPCAQSKVVRGALP